MDENIPGRSTIATIATDRRDTAGTPRRATAATDRLGDDTVRAVTRRAVTGRDRTVVIDVDIIAITARP